MGLKDVGDPVELAKQYDLQCADEVVFLDITATYENRDIIRDLIERAASELSIPLAVGGGIRDVYKRQEHQHLVQYDDIIQS